MSHTHLPDPLDKRYSEVRNITLIGAGIDLLLGVAKLVVGTLAHSQALIADGVHSLSDLATDFLVLFAAKHAHRRRRGASLRSWQDRDGGHGRAGCCPADGRHRHQL